MVKTLLLASAALTAVVPSVAAAALVNTTINFVAGPFNGADNSVPPYAAVTGSLSLTYDPSQVGSQGDVTVNALSIAYGSNARYIIYGGGQLGIYTTNYTNGVSGTFTAGVNGFAAVFSNLNPPVGTSGGTFNYSQVGYQSIASTRTVLVTNAVTGGVPEPATWTLMLLGFGGVGYTLRRRPARLSLARRHHLVR